MSTRFDYVTFDEEVQAKQLHIKELFIQLETELDTLVPGRSKALALTSLEESYM